MMSKPMLKMTQHAKQRLRQRGIPRNVVHLVQAYGTPDHQGRVVMSPKLARELEALFFELARHMGKIAASNKDLVIIERADYETDEPILITAYRCL
ncbi:MAG: hypothetical protein HC926_05210 [Synechococcaceae cyanobacterium SM2_3_60]|nr:hypothetical protein [Synechococcaceae cyanobacterium SM2_3_60]